MKSTSNNTIGLIISKHSEYPAAHAARLNDALRSPAVKSAELKIKIFSVNDAKGSKLARYITTFKKVLEFRRTVDVIHFSYFPPAFIPLFIISLKKPVVLGPNVTGSAFPDKFLNDSAIKARSEEKRFHTLKRFLNGNALTDILNTRLCSKASTILTLSNYASDIVSSRGIAKNRLEVLPFAAPLGIATPAEDLPWDSNKKTIAYVGRLDKRKGFDIFLNLTKNLDKDVVFLVIGDGRLREDLISLAEVDQRVVWIGKKERSELLSIVPHIDIYFQPSTYEAIATTVLEALRCSVPVVSADIPSHLELKTYGGVRFFESGNSENAAAVVAAAIDDYKALKTEAVESCLRYDVDVPGRWLIEKYISLCR